jgi:hypothetical protein
MRITTIISVLVVAAAAVACADSPTDPARSITPTGVAHWERGASGAVTGVSLEAPPAGSRAVTIQLDADAVAADVRAYAFHRFAGRKSPDIEITGALDRPFDANAIEAGASYSWDAPFAKRDGGTPVELWITVETVNSRGVVVDTHTAKLRYDGEDPSI